MGNSRRRVRVGVAVACGTALLALAACSHPKLVTAVTSSKDNIKFLYVEGDEQGVLKCAAAPDGSLSNCTKMRLELEE